GVYRAADLTRFESKGHRRRSSHRTDVRNLTVRSHKIAGLDLSAGFLGCLPQIVFRLGLIRKLLGLLTQQLCGSLVLELIFQSIANLRESWSGRRLDICHLVDDEPGVDRSNIRWRIFSLGENHVHELGICPDAR